MSALAPSDQLLVNRIRGGESDAWNELIARFEGRLLAFVEGRLGRRTAGEDVVQETWARFVRGYTAIDQPAAVYAWLTVTARREAWRTVKLADRVDAEQTENLEPRLTAEPSAEDAAVRRISDATLWRCVTTLSERCQRLLRIIAFEERPDYQRIAEETGMPVGSIGPTRSRCLDRLRTALEGEGMR